MQAADNGQIEICVGASSYANSGSSGLAKSSEACFTIEIMDEDTMPPLFCTAAELQANNFESRDQNTPFYDRERWSYDDHVYDNLWYDPDNCLLYTSDAADE